MKAHPDLSALMAEQLRVFAAGLLVEVEQKEVALQQKDRTILHHKTLNDKLPHELAILKRHRFARRNESLAAQQGSLLDELRDADIGAIEEELAQAAQSLPDTVQQKRTPTRTPLPPELPRTLIAHEPDATTCRCGCQLTRIGEEISEKLDYTPGTFTIECHVRGKRACGQCERLVRAPLPAQVIDKGLPTRGLLAHVLVAKYANHLPLYRQENIFGRAGLTIARSTLADWVGRCGVALLPLVDALRDVLLGVPVLHADETPVPMLAPGKKQTHRAYVWAYASTPFSPVKGVVYAFASSRAGEHARQFLQGWQGKLVCDDFSGYKASFGQGITEIGYMAHARRKFFELHAANKSQLAEFTLQQIARLYEIGRQVQPLAPEQRHQLRQKVPNGSAIAGAIDYSLKRWTALSRYCDDGAVPIDNNWVENQIRPWALGRANWLFAGSLRSGQRAAAVMSLIQSARMNGHDPFAYLKYVLERLPTQRASAISELLPHNWAPSGKV